MLESESENKPTERKYTKYEAKRNSLATCMLKKINNLGIKSLTAAGDFFFENNKNLENFWPEKSRIIKTYENFRSPKILKGGVLIINTPVLSSKKSQVVYPPKTVTKSLRAESSPRSPVHSVTAPLWKSVFVRKRVVPQLLTTRNVCDTFVLCWEVLRWSKHHQYCQNQL